MGPLTMGVDIGQAADPTAMVVVQTGRTTPLDPRERPQRFHVVRAVEKVPLGTPYPQVVERIVSLAERAALEARVTIVLDATGIGRAIVDLLRRATSLPIRAVTITAGSTATAEGPHSLRVPKRDLVAALEIVMQTRRLIVAPGLRLAEDLRDELQAFTFALSDAGRDSYEAASGSHDDLVVALALAVHRAERGDSADALRALAARDGIELPPPRLPRLHRRRGVHS